MTTIITTITIKEGGSIAGVTVSALGASKQVQIGVRLTLARKQLFQNG
jgi:hypothetical protein